WHFEEYTQSINDPLGSWGTWASASRFLPSGTNTPTATATRTPTAGPTNTVVSTRTTSPTPSVTSTPSVTPSAAVIVVGHVTWQGRPSQPNAAQQLPITLTVRSGALEINYPQQTTDAS